MAITPVNVGPLLAHTERLFANLHGFQCVATHMPGKSHRAIAITHQDLNERRDDFIDELKNSMNSWVYSKARYEKLIDDALIERDGDKQSAASFVHNLVRRKFRRGFPQGQFGELLLFNIIQHYFEAVPLLRKMPITTNPKIERHGSDAIHYKPDGPSHKLFLGEAKSYTAKNRFGAALRDAVDSILDAHANIQNELGLYIYDDFIDDALLPIAKAIKNNREVVTIELVSIISYEETADKSGPSEAEIKMCMERIVNDRLAKFRTSFFNGKCPITLGRLHVFVMPVWDFSDLLVRFEA